MNEEEMLSLLDDLQVETPDLQGDDPLKWKSKASRKRGKFASPCPDEEAAGKRARPGYQPKARPSQRSRRARDPR